MKHFLIRFRPHLLPALTIIFVLSFFTLMFFTTPKTEETIPEEKTQGNTWDLPPKAEPIPYTPNTPNPKLEETLTPSDDDTDIRGGFWENPFGMCLTRGIVFD